MFWNETRAFAVENMEHILRSLFKIGRNSGNESKKFSEFN